MLANKKSEDIAFINELVKAILFIILAIVVFTLIAKACSNTAAIPAYSKSLSLLQKSINALSIKNPEITRTVAIQLKGYSLVGFTNESGMCTTSQGTLHCICACDDLGCSNAKKDTSKFCKPINYEPKSDFSISQESDKIITYSISLEKATKGYVVKLNGINVE